MIDPDHMVAIILIAATVGGIPVAGIEAILRAWNDQ